MIKYLILGATGFLGSYLYDYLSDSRENVDGTYYRKKRKDLYYLNLENGFSVKEVIKQTKPSIIIHAGGLTNTDYCALNKEESLRVNVKGTKELVSFFDKKIIYFSTDYVFDGLTGNYNENAKTSPINHYGLTKLLAEREVLRNPNNLVVRVSGLFGVNKSNNRFLSGLKERKWVYAYSNLITSPTYINDIADSIDSLIGMNGVVHFAGLEPLSRYEFMRAVAEMMGFDCGIHPLEYKDGMTQAKRPKTTNLTSIRKHFNKTSLDTAIKEMREELHEKG